MDIHDLQALMGEAAETDDYRDLWVVAPAPELPAELIGEARRLADALGAYVHYVGPAEAASAIACGSDRVHPLAADSADAALAALVPLFEERKPEMVLLRAGIVEDEIAARLAERLGGGAIADCVALRLDESRRELVASHPVYDGAYYLDSASLPKPQIITVRAGALPPAVRDDGRAGETEDLAQPGEGTGRVRAQGKVDVSPPAVPLRKAARVVAVGRAGNDADGVAAAKGIAEKIGAHFAGDRSAFDSGWIGEEQIVGVVGTEIAPDLYLAAGIWGDILHRAGVERARHLIAIHPDKDAPIFAYADAALIGQPKDILPRLLALL